VKWGEGELKQGVSKQRGRGYIGNFFYSVDRATIHLPAFIGTFWSLLFIIQIFIVFFALFLYIHFFLDTRLKAHF